MERLGNRPVDSVFPLKLHIRRSVFLMGVALAMILTGCRSLDDEDPVDSPLTTYRGIPSGDDASLEGVLTLTNGCLVSISTFPSAVTPTVPPAGLTFALPSSARWNESEQSISYQGVSVRLGQVARMGGGVVLGSFDNWSNPPAEGCPGGGTFLAGDLFNCTENPRQCLTTRLTVTP